MAEVITLAKMPHGNGNKFEMTAAHKEFYINNNSTMQMREIAKQIGTSTATMYRLVKEHNLPEKMPTLRKKEAKVTKFFDWDNATLLDPIQGYSRKHY